MALIKIDINPTALELFRNNASVVNVDEKKKYYFLPYWIEQNGENFFMHPLGKLPPDLKQMINEKRMISITHNVMRDENLNNTKNQNAKRVLDEFNKIFGKSHKMNDYRLRTISARIKEGLKETPPLSLADFRLVFLYKKSEWESDAESAKWLTIETLCARKHFQKYLDQAREAKTKQGNTAKIQGSILTAR